MLVVAIFASGIAIGRKVGTDVERRVGAPPTRSVARAEPVRPPATGFYAGLYREGAPYDRQTLDEMERDAGVRPALVMWYHEWHGAPPFPAAEAARLAARGTVPVISWEPWRPPVTFGDLVVDQPAYRLDAIANGAFDRYIRWYADQVRAYGGPVMLRPFHEMDGTWYPWGGTVNGNRPGDLVRAWRHVHDIFDAAGATNVTWVWSVNHRSVPDSPRNALERYWPGARHVDWIGISGFNWGRASPLTVWRGIDAVIGDRYRELQRYGKPIALMETGAPETGGDKAAWIADTYERLTDAYPEIGAVIWYDRRDSPQRDWRITSSPAALAAFRRTMARPFVRAADAAVASTLPGSWRGAPPATDDFTAQRADAWGPAWECSGTHGSTPAFTVAGGAGLAALPDGASRSACLHDGDHANVDVAATFSAGVGHRTPQVSVLLRAAHAARHYAMTVLPGSPAFATIVRTSFGRRAELARVRLPFAIEPGEAYRIAARARTASDGVRLAMRAWRAGDLAPATWTLTVTDGARERLARGRGGIGVAGDGRSLVRVDDVAIG